jgi:predicted nucleic acid-binding protein
MPPSLAARADAGVTPLPLLLDTTVLNNFIKIGRLSLLRQLFPASLRIATQVFDELKAGGLDGHIRQGVTEAWLRMVQPESGRESALYREYLRTLGSGESASLAIAICRSWALATDDRAARAAAGAAGVDLTGSVGILIVAVRAGFITRQEGDQLLQEMRRHGYRFPLEGLESLL